MLSTYRNNHLGGTICLGLVLILSCLTCMAATPPKTHNHTPLEISAKLPTPQLQLQLYPDSMSGYNLSIQVEHFNFKAPQYATTPMTDLSILEGHAHLYINGDKVGRLYSTEQHIPQTWLLPGHNQITVTLNTHEHQNLQKNGKDILASIILNTTQTPAEQQYITPFPIVTAP